MGQNRNAFVTMQECAQHVPYQLPNAQTGVTHLLDNIHCDNAPLQAAMELVCNDMIDTGTVLAKMNDFEAAVSFIIPHNPVVSKKNKRSLSDISTTDGEASNNRGDQVSSYLVKPPKGKTGVELRFYKTQEYRNIPKQQKEELYEWIERKRQKAGGDGQGSSDKKKIASAMSKELEKRDKAVEQEAAVNSDFEKCIRIIMANANKGKGSAAISTSANFSDSKTRPVTIKSILKRAAT